MKTQNLKYLNKFRNSRALNTKYGRFGSFLELLVPFQLSLGKICKLECILELTDDTKSNENQYFGYYGKSILGCDVIDKFDIDLQMETMETAIPLRE